MFRIHTFIQSAERLKYGLNYYQNPEFILSGLMDVWQRLIEMRADELGRTKRDRDKRERKRMGKEAAKLNEQCVFPPVFLGTSCVHVGLACMSPGNGGGKTRRRIERISSASVHAAGCTIQLMLLLLQHMQAVTQAGRLVGRS